MNTAKNSLNPGDIQVPPEIPKTVRIKETGIQTGAFLQLRANHTIRKRTEFI